MNNNKDSNNEESNNEESNNEESNNEESNNEETNNEETNNEETNNEETNNECEVLPTEKLTAVIGDMLKDLLTTFPELNDSLDKNLQHIMNDEDEDNESIKKVQMHCESVFPERFFDILYQNEDIFEDHKINTEFLPNIDFSQLWKENITENTKKSLWKYLQIILFTVISNVSDQKSFGDTAKLFEAINQDEFKKKLEDTMEEMQNMFSSATKDNDAGAGTSEAGTSEAGTSEAGTSGAQKKRTPFPGMDNMPDPKELQDHISEMMDGKLGSLAKEIAEETANDLNIDMTNAESANDVFQKLFKQPTKLMSLIKNVGSKLDEKMKSGDIKESELLEEANKMMQKMKNMPGMSNMKEMFAKMGMPSNMNMSGKMNMGATEANLKRNMRGAQQRDRMREKLASRQSAQGQSAQGQSAQGQSAQGQSAQGQSAGECEDVIINKVFSTGETYEKSAKRTITGNKKKKRKKKVKSKK